MEKILILDNYDSFTYNIASLVRSLGYPVEVRRNDEITPEQAGEYPRVIVSPGPGLPCESGILPEYLARYAHCRSILGICLGEQAIGERFGARLRNLENVYHGVAAVRVVAPDPIFEDWARSFWPGVTTRGWWTKKGFLPNWSNGARSDGSGDGFAAPSVRRAGRTVPSGAC